MDAAIATSEAQGPHSLAPPSLPDIEPLLQRRDARKAANDRAWRAADRDGSPSIECACECISVGCEARFTADRIDFWEARVRRWLAMAPDHAEFDLEREWKRYDGWVQVAAPNPASGSLDSKTLKDHAEFLGSEFEAARSELTALNNRIATSLITGALVISLFANVLPEDLDRVAVLFVLGGLILFLPIAWRAIHSPQDIEQAWIASGDPIPTALQKWKEDPWLSVTDSPLGIESYEQWHRMEAHRIARHEHRVAETYAEAQLAEGDYLVSQVNLLKRKIANISQRSERARRVLKSVHWWLSLLVVYLVVMVVFVRLL